MKTLYWCCVILAASGAMTITSAQQDTRPYAPIAVPLPDTLDQLYRDSATIKIGRVRVNQAGYRVGDDKYFYYVGSGASSFSVINVATGASAATGTLTSKSASVSGQIKIRASNNAQITAGGDTRYRMESAAVSGTLYEGKIDVTAQGNYRVVVGRDTSAPFWIHKGVYSWVRDAAIKFPGVNRCGDSESWFHGACHLKDATQGGWHDCGDHLKESITQSFLHSMLGLASAALRDRDADHYGANQNNTVLTDGVPDVLYEARHGSQYVINAYNNARGDVSKMITAVGGFGPDHQWWGQPEMQDRMSTERGGPPREARNEVGANIMGNFAAGLALTAKNYAVFDQRFADTSIAIAKKMYEYGKAHLDVATQTPAYSGNGIVNDKMAFAALALAWATGERKYLNELCYDRTIGSKTSNADGTQSAALFQGGWFTHTDPVFSKHTANTDWASPHMAVKWGFFRLILKDPEMCEKLGIDENERKALLSRTLHNIIFDLGMVSAEGTTIALPATGLWNRDAVSYGSVWGNMHIQQDWMWNRYQFGNIFDMYCYSDMAMWMEDNGVPLRGASNQWVGGVQQTEEIYNLKGKEVRQAMIRQMDYMLGVNPWDVSMVYGVGAKNFNHPHHRAANPEGKNVPGAFYPYRPPVGALAGAVKPDVTGGVYEEHFDNYHVTETGIDASAVMIIPIMGLAEEDPITGPPTATVRTIYVGYDMAIIEVRQTRYGNTTIRYAEDGSGNFTRIENDSAGVFHRIVLTNLKGGTKYNFDALVSDMYGNSGVILDDRGEMFTFTTLKTPPGDAEITNVKVCNVTSDTAEIFWYTPNGSYDSRVVYDTKKPPTANVHDGNIYGRPTQFHYVKIGGLKEKTTYYFYVESNGARDDNGGQYYEFTTPVEHVNFDVRAALYSEGGHHFIGLNVINQDIKAYDSLELRLYVRAPETISVPDPMNPGTNRTVAFENHFAFRVDIGIKYRSDGYQDTHFKTEVDALVESTRPIKMDDTYDPATGTWAYYIPVPLGPAEMQSGARFRLDLMLETRSPWPPYEDLMNETPLKLLDPKIDWSFMPHSRANGEPVDYPGTPTGTKDAILDGDYWNTPINQYITVYRKNEFIWGYSPSTKEQQTKKTHYEMTSQITSPLYNPAEEYLFMEQVVNTITVNGWARVTENGAVNDVWVNGNRVRDVNTVVKYNSAADRWDFAVPVPVRNGGNNIDITLFGGPEAECATCYGCAFSNHSFYLEFRGAEPHASSIKLLDCADQSVEVRDSARIDETCFYVYVDDMNGNVTKDRRDTVWVSVANPVFGDSLIVPLVETGDSTGRFVSASPVRVVSALPSQRGPNEISMDGGQTIVVTYVDPTDPEDVSRAALASRAEFPVPVSAWFKDSTGIGSIDLIYVKYSKAFASGSLPDSLQLTIPDLPGRTVKAPGAVISLDAADPSLVRFYLGGAALAGVTGFRAGGQMTARSFLTYNNMVKEAVIQVQDKAGPALLDRALLMEKTGGVYDTLQLDFSEPMQGGQILGATLTLLRNGSEYPLNVLSVVNSSQVSNTLTLLVDPANIRIMEGDSVRIDPTGLAADSAGNKAHRDNRYVPIELKSLSPRIVTGFYTDLNADGIIDRAEFTFSKPLEFNGLYNNIHIQWENGPETLVDWQFLAPLGQSGTDVTGVGVDVGAMGLTGGAVATGGQMSVRAAHNKFPGDTLRHSLSDKAAPVILSASFSPGRGNAQDTLAVTFSEPLWVVQSSSSFRFQYTENGVNTEYGMDVLNNNMKPSNVQTFLATLHDTTRFPSRGDSIWINHMVTVSDTNYNQQQNENNRKAPLSVKPAPITFTVIPAPNPFKAGPTNAGGGKARIIVRPDKLPNDIEITGKIVIYDKMGNRVRSDNLRFDPNLPDPLYYEWNGMSDRGRFAGTGTYVITVSAEYGYPNEKKLGPEKGRALLYMLR